MPASGVHADKTQCCTEIVSAAAALQSLDIDIIMDQKIKFSCCVDCQCVRGAEGTRDFWFQSPQAPTVGQLRRGGGAAAANWGRLPCHWQWHPGVAYTAVNIQYSTSPGWVLARIAGKQFLVLGTVLYCTSTSNVLY